MTKDEKDRLEPEDTLPQTIPPANGAVPVRLPVKVEDDDPVDTEWVTDEEAGKMLCAYMRQEVGPYWCSVPTDTPANKALGYNAMAKAAGKIKDQLNKMILVQHVAVTISRWSNEYGEVLTRPRLTLVTPDGDTYTSVGKVVTRVFRDLIARMGLPPWAPPLPLWVEPVKGTKENRDSFTLVIDTERWVAWCNGEEPVDAHPRKAKK